MVDGGYGRLALGTKFRICYHTVGYSNQSIRRGAGVSIPNCQEPRPCLQQRRRRQQRVWRLLRSRRYWPGTLLVSGVHFPHWRWTNELFIPKLAWFMWSSLSDNELWSKNLEKLLETPSVLQLRNHRIARGSPTRPINRWRILIYRLTIDYCRADTVQCVIPTLELSWIIVHSQP